ncbi:hypothetical protein ABT354_28290 [Streptomyces sp. NPDC000594]|uniref:hypothetical protein n=1 Tax=Streptomyces sp. NPDC000594 TaxID=3154261 RepID=UPI00331B5290
MDIRSVDPRETAWEQDHGRYRVYFWDRSAGACEEYEVLGDRDVDEVLAWAAAHAAEHGWTHTVYLAVEAAEGLGLVRLSGVAGDPLAD